MSYIKDATNKTLTPVHMLTASLYATWDIKSNTYKMALEEFRENSRIIYDKNEEFREICRIKATEIFEGKSYYWQPSEKTTPTADDLRVDWPEVVDRRVDHE